LPPNSLGSRHAEDAELTEAVDDVARNVGVAIDRRGVDFLCGELAQIGDGLFDDGLLVGPQVGNGNSKSLWN